MKALVPVEFALPVALFALIALLLGKKKAALASLTLAVLIAFYPVFHDFILIFVPPWMSVAFAIITAFAALKFLLNLTIGRTATNQAIGTLAADALRTVLTAPFAMLRKLAVLPLLRGVFSKLLRLASKK